MPVVKPIDLPLLTAAEVSKLVQLPQRTVENMAREGRLPVIRIGRHVRFSRAAVEATVLEAMESGRPL